MLTLEKLSSHAISPCIELNTAQLAKRNIRLFVKRDDMLHLPIQGNKAFCGNKWRKLKYNLIQAQAAEHTQLLTFGGAFSNHIAATASAGALFGFKTIGIIRGESPNPLNPTLIQAQQCGMELHFITRSAYRKKTEATFIQELEQQFGRFYLLPEGGTNPEALKGCRELASEIRQTIIPLPDYICIAVGTGGTMTGLIQGMEGKSQLIGFSALKGDFLTKEISSLLAIQSDKNYSNWSIQTEYHFGGFAKFKPDLIDFINQFKSDFDLSLDPIYTGKLFFGIFDLIEKGAFEDGATIVAIHSGGLQGIDGFNHRFGHLIL